jgi:5'-3' exonuclease
MSDLFIEITENTYQDQETMTQTPIFIFIDGSYFCFYRYYSLLTWWKNAYPENPLEDPIANEQFVEKFKKTFTENMKIIPKKIGLDKTDKPIFIVGKDCKRENIWRNEYFDKYKEHRKNSMEDGFMGGPFFKMAYEENLFVNGGAKAILKHPHLEADDCIALSVKHILKTIPHAKIYVITSDKDYLQIACERVRLFSLTFKELTEQKSSHGDAEMDLFCKIVTGDQSDGIPSVFKKCGPKTALKYYNDQELFYKKLEEDVEAKKIYERNKKIIDFDEIPKNLVDEFMKTIIR